MTTTNNTHAAQADRFVKAAQAAMFAARESADPDGMYAEAKFAIDAAQIHSRLAVAEAIERSHQLVKPIEFTSGGEPLPDDEIGRRLVEHIAAHARAVASDRSEFLRG